MGNEKLNPTEIRDAVREFVAKITERKPSEISDTAHFRDDLEIDSLMAMEMMVAVNRKYRIEILDEEFRNISNVREAADAVLRHLATDAR